MIVYLTKVLSVLFLLLQEKNQKKQAKGALGCRAPARQIHPLWKPPARTADGAVHKEQYSLRCSRGYGDAGRVGYIGAGGFDCGSNRLNAAPMLTSLVTFLFSDKKVT